MVRITACLITYDNNAGIQVPPSDAAGKPAENFDRVNATNLRGVWTCMKHELRLRRANEHPRQIRRDYPTCWPECGAGPERRRRALRKRA